MSNHAPVTVLLMPWGRVGSNLVNSIIKQAPNVVVHNEPLTGIDTRGRREGLSRENIAQLQDEWLEEHIVAADHGRPIFLNLAAVHILDPNAFRKRLAPVEPTYVILDRVDVVATVISAMRTSAWVREGQEIGEERSWSIPKGASVDFRPAMDSGEFTNMVDLIDLGRSIIDQVTEGRNATRYLYEDIVNDMDGVMTDIFAKARIPYIRYEIRSAKFGSKALGDMIANPEDITKVIRAKKIATDLLLPA